MLKIYNENINIDYHSYCNSQEMVDFKQYILNLETAHQNYVMNVNLEGVKSRLDDIMRMLN